MIARALWVLGTTILLVRPARAKRTAVVTPATA
jgi:hypothetical protein